MALSAQPPLPKFDKAPPKRFPCFRLGPNLVEWQTTTGRVRDVIWVDEDDVEIVLIVFRAQGNALPIYKEHDDRQGSFGAGLLDKAADGGIDQIWALNADGLALVASGRWMFDSPEPLTRMDSQGRKHLREIRSFSLVNVPARTNSRPLLMSAKGSGMDETVMNARKCLEHLGALEGCVKGMSGASHDGLKKAHELLSSVLGPASAHVQSALEDLDKDGMSATTAPNAIQRHTMSAQVRDAAELGTEVLKMTGAASKDEALGIMEARQNQVTRMTAKLADLGVETGRLPAADKDKYAKYEPGRLIAVIDNSAPMQMGARREQEAQTDARAPKIRSSSAKPPTS
jgi:hypothetical protein